MCGIFGILCFNGAVPEEKVLKRMGQLLKHRGPDAQKIELYRSGSLSCYLGANRLKVIDLSDNANMPITNEDGNIAAVFNGEIYNFESLRQEQKNRNCIGGITSKPARTRR